MCGRYTLAADLAVLLARFDVDVAVWPHEPRYNIAPGQQVPAIVETASGTRRLGALRWGLVPSWANDPRIGSRLLNARAETAAAKPAFRDALARRRCLIPADGFYEWDKRGGGKQPLRFLPKDGGLFAMAGLYETWTSPDGAKLHTCTILTTAPNELVAPIHDRMPVILSPEAESLWLDRRVTDASALAPLLKPYPGERMTAYPVNPSVGRVGFDDPSCLQPLA
ncbi:SOS response-associated peptidase [Paenibacillus thermoaerophilus]|uniref:Abasic site processing protein n=1 Tax=Paenibacillus thermoaerophilus TaxID=1215385 RepID=A0ABW2V839_9BACL|nr:SOS response-associated peptidase [Paenibacillus thermoaerophilus]TMV16133.1 SOS response-associated peptidase [Paenibacillus thermoaerophilus]